MIVHSHLLRNPKFMLLRTGVGPAALECLVRLWEHCEDAQRGARWGKVGADYVEAVCKWTGERGCLWKLLTVPTMHGKGPWINLGRGGIVIHDWEEHNAGLISRWNNGKKGGRPVDKQTLELRQSKAKTDQPPVIAGLPGSTDGITTENPPVSEGLPADNPLLSSTEQSRALLKYRERERVTGHLPEVNGHDHGPNLPDVLAWGKMDAVPEDECRKFFAHYSGLGWMHGNTPITHARHWLGKWKVRAARNPNRNSPRHETMLDKKDRKANTAERIKNHPANPEAGYSEPPTEAEKLDYETLQKQYEKLVKEMSQEPI